MDEVWDDPKISNESLEKKIEVLTDATTEAIFKLETRIMMLEERVELDEQRVDRMLLE
jgi:hypothetical protein